MNDEEYETLERQWKEASLKRRHDVLAISLDAWRHSIRCFSFSIYEWREILKTLLLSGLLLSTCCHAQTFGDWYTYKKEKSYAAQTNSGPASLIYQCFLSNDDQLNGKCLYLLDLHRDCINDHKYHIKIQTDLKTIKAQVQCYKDESTPAFLVFDYDDIDNLIRTGGYADMTYSLKAGGTASTYFSLNGSRLALSHIESKVRKLNKTDPQRHSAI